MNVMQVERNENMELVQIILLLKFVCSVGQAICIVVVDAKLLNTESLKLEVANNEACKANLY